MIIAGADNRPPMLEKSLYDLWKSRMELYIENRENGRMILNSVQNGPLVWPTIVEENGTTRTNKSEELSVAEKLQADCDLKATNIVTKDEGNDGVEVSLTPIVISAAQSKNGGVTEWYQEPKIIKGNVIPPDHVDDLPVVEPNQPDDVPVIPEHVLEDEDEDPKEEEFEEEEEPQEEEDDMEVDIEKDDNESELTFPYEEANPLNPPPPSYDSEPKDVIEVEDTVEHRDETVPASVHEVGESSTAPFL
ncbi:hypothetical protein Tco_0127139 [Tanacetum coccineum]